MSALSFHEFVRFFSTPEGMSALSKTGAWFTVTDGVISSMVEPVSN